MKARRKVTRRRPWLAVDSPEGRAALRRVADALERDPYRKHKPALPVDLLLAALGIGG